MDEPRMKPGKNVNSYVVVGVSFLAFPFAMSAFGFNLREFVMFVFFSVGLLLLSGGVVQYAIDNI